MATLVIWHGYLLRGTGSNIYTSSIVDAWVRDGHDVVLMCQDPHPEQHASIHVHERVRGREVIERRELATPPPGNGTCTMVQAEVGPVLPVYVLDRYQEFDEVRRFIDLTDDELDRYGAAYAAAMEGVLERFDPHGVLVNHAVVGPAALRPVLDAAGVPYVVKVHGSELEYCIAEDDRFVEPARDGLAGARSILVGSRHIERRMVDLLGSDCLGGRVELVPPGVDLDLFRPATDLAARRDAHRRLVEVVRAREHGSAGRGPAHAAALRDALLAGTGAASGTLVERLRDLHGAYDERAPEIGVADRLAEIDVGRDRIVSFVGRSIRQKGVQLLIAAMPLVLVDHPDARFVIVGHGMMREGLEALVHALSGGDRQLVDYLLGHGNALDGGPDEPLHYLANFFAVLDADRATDSYYAAARGLAERVTFCGQVGHETLSLLWPICHASVVPSIGAEAFGMVSAEAAASGCPPVVAYHSGLADVADALVRDYPSWGRGLASFSLEVGYPVKELAQVLSVILSLPPDRHAELAAAARAVVEGEWSWHSIAARIAATLTPSAAAPVPAPR